MKAVKKEIEVVQGGEAKIFKENTFRVKSTVAPEYCIMLCKFLRVGSANRQPPSLNNKRCLDNKSSLNSVSSAMNGFDILYVRMTTKSLCGSLTDSVGT